MSTSPASKVSLETLKSKRIQDAVLHDLSSKETAKALPDKPDKPTGVPASQLALLKGFPPKRISYETGNLVESLGLQHQDTIIVELDTTGCPNKGEEPSPGNSEGSVPPRKKPKMVAGMTLVLASSIDPNAPDDMLMLVPCLTPAPPGNYEEGPDTGILLRQRVPPDNSCLFTSVAFCVYGQRWTDNMKQKSCYLREVVASRVASDPGKYSEAILGCENADYVNWIKKPESWGGGIELSILAEAHRMEIAVISTPSLHISYFGEDQNYLQRIYLIYDGSHYDPLYFEPFTGGSITTIFVTTNTNIVDLAMQLAREATACNQLTDVKNFSFRCETCNTLLKDETEAQEHAKKTTHASFDDIDNQSNLVFII